MPTSASILGFTNRWYAGAIETATSCQLAPSLAIRLITAPYFLATKLEAFDGRGEGDYEASADLEDIVALVDGRAELVDEVDDSAAPLRHHLRRRISELLDTARFVGALPGHLPGDVANQQRLPLVVQRLERIAGRVAGPQQRG